MKKLIVSLLLVSFTTTFYGQKNEYTINGKLPDESHNGKYVMLYKENPINKDILLDSVLVSENRFIFKGFIDKPILAYVGFKDRQEPVAYKSKFIIEQGDINLDIESYAYGGMASGTPINDDYKNMVSVYQVKRNSLMIPDKSDKDNFPKDFFNQKDENKLLFAEKYVVYPDVIEGILNSYILTMNPAFTKDNNTVRVNRILEQFPKERPDCLYKYNEEIKIKAVTMADSVQAAYLNYMNNK